MWQIIFNLGGAWCSCAACTRWPPLLTEDRSACAAQGSLLKPALRLSPLKVQIEDDEHALYIRNYRPNEICMQFWILCNPGISLNYISSITRLIFLIENYLHGFWIEKGLSSKIWPSSTGLIIRNYYYILQRNWWNFERSYLNGPRTLCCTNIIAFFRFLCLKYNQQTKPQ